MSGHKEIPSDPFTMMLDELQRRNYAQTTVAAYVPCSAGVRAVLPTAAGPARLGTHPAVSTLDHALPEILGWQLIEYG